MEILKNIENRYSGIPAIINAMERYGLPKPKFENERGIFRVTLYNKRITFEKDACEKEEVLNFCTIARTRAEIEEHFKGRYNIRFIMSRFICPMINSGELLYTIPEKPRSKFQKYVKR